MRKCLILLIFILMILPASAEEGFTPGRERCGKPGCFWETPMDPTDSETVWAMLTAPMTVLKGNLREQVYLRAEPDAKSDIIGEVTCATQGVHVLEHLEDGWSRIECYSSSFKGSTSRAWNQLVCGYIRTDLLKEYKVKTKYGLVVDKLDQRLYLYQGGELLDVLAVSTGSGTEEQPYNETRSGEYLLYSRTGAFPSDRMTCNYGIRYNDGDLLHEVPHIVRSNGNRDYGKTEPLLGQRASHGCIRVQRKRTANGINMRWLWEALYTQMGTRMVIWEDWTGRQLPYPADDMAVYYNKADGENYHREPACYGVKDRYEPMQPLLYAQLSDAEYAGLTACPYCIPARRAEEIDAINAAHQPVSEVNGRNSSTFAAPIDE